MYLWGRQSGVLVSLLGLSIALHLPLTARAEGSDEVQSYVRSIAQLYENFEHGRALEQLKRVKPLVRKADDEVLLSLYEGLILVELGKQEDARATFRTALLVKPEAKLPVVVSPKVRKLFESLRQQVKRELGPLLTKDAERQRLESQTRAEAEQQRQAEKRRLSELKRVEVERQQLPEQNRAEQELERELNRQLEREVKQRLAK